MSVARFAIWVLLLLAVVLSGVQVASTSQEVRRLHVVREEARSIVTTVHSFTAALAMTKGSAFLPPFKIFWRSMFC